MCVCVCVCVCVCMRAGVRACVSVSVSVCVLVFTGKTGLMLHVWEVMLTFQKKFYSNTHREKYRNPSFLTADCLTVFQDAVVNHNEL